MASRDPSVIRQIWLSRRLRADDQIKTTHNAAATDVKKSRLRRSARETASTAVSIGAHRWVRLSFSGKSTSISRTSSRCTLMWYTNSLPSFRKTRKEPSLGCCRPCFCHFADGIAVEIDTRRAGEQLRQVFAWSSPVAC